MGQVKGRSKLWTPTRPADSFVDDGSFFFVPGPNFARDWKLNTGTANWHLVANASSMGPFAIDFVGYQWWEYRWNIPYDAQSVYHARTQLHQHVTGTTVGTTYVGFAGVAHDGATYINDGGADSFGSQHYRVMAGESLPTSEVLRTAAWAGYKNWPLSHKPGISQAHDAIRYYRPLIIANYASGTGTLRCHGYSITRQVAGLGATDTIDQGWTAASLLNGWVNYGTQHSTGHPLAAYRRENGRVFLRGLIQPGTLDTAAFQLPPGFRPANPRGLPAGENVHHIATQSSAGALQLWVSADGLIRPRGGGAGMWVDLANINFPAG